MLKPIRTLLVALIAVVAACPAHAQEMKTLTLDGENITIARDRYGVPHVSANSLRGLFYGNGYAIAEDRLGQMELYRRSARGEMAELVGPDALNSDRETRIDGYTDEEREQQFRRLPADLRAMFAAYADGVNAYMDDLKANPRPIHVANYPGAFDPAAMRPWRVVDSIAIGQMMARRFGGDEGGELRNLLIINMLKSRYPKDAWRLFNDLAWRNDRLAPTTIPAAEDPRAKEQHPPFWADDSGKRIGGPSFPAFDPAAAKRAADILDQKARMEAAQRYGLMTKWGSYAIAVNAHKSASGSAMLVGGPQMGFRTPQIAHEIGLSGAGIYEVGMGFAGVPGVLIGHNGRLAWTTTTGVNDETDIFVEKLDPTDPTRYRYKGAWRTMEKRTEVINIKGVQTLNLEVYRTVHGPVVQWDKPHNLAYARCSSYRGKELGTFEAEARFARARNVREFGAACALITTSHNFLCATQDGDIGYWFCGLTPLRDPRQDPRLPTPGDGSREWRAFLPFERMPHSVNPKQGFLANWNTKPAVWWDNQDTPVWGQVWRSSRIAELLRAKPTVSAEDLRNVLLDIGTNDEDARVFAPLLNAAVRRSPSVLSASARRAAAYLAAWNHHGSDGSVAMTLFDAWFQQLREDLFLKPFGFVPDKNLFNIAMQPSFMLHVLEGTGSPVPPQYDYLHGLTPARVMLEALNTAVAKLAKKNAGVQMDAWRWKQPTIDFKPLPPIPATNRGTYIQIVTCARPLVQGVSICPPGQSERTDSPHFGDQRELAGWFQFKPMEGAK